MDHVMTTPHIRGKQPSQAMWWLAGRLLILAEALHHQLELNTQASMRLAEAARERLMKHSRESPVHRHMGGAQHTSWSAVLNQTYAAVYKRWRSVTGHKVMHAQVCACRKQASHHELYLQLHKGPLLAHAMQG